MGGNGFHRVRGRIAAGCLEAFDGVMDRTYGGRKRALFGAPPRQVVEIGPGTGANLRYYPPGTRLTAVEPNPSMHPRLRRRASRLAIDLAILPDRAEAMDLPDASAELVVGTMVLCSVQRPEAVLSEILRILVPGGRYAFIEHVAADAGTLTERIQGLLRRPWPLLFDGCHIDRSPHRLLSAAGFERVDVGRFLLDGILLPVRPHVFGQAFKGLEGPGPRGPTP
jgi:ubiquinone/menaquinone biosynthesis C-methylase UbiE